MAENRNLYLFLLIYSKPDSTAIALQRQTFFNKTARADEKSNTASIRIEIQFVGF